MSFLPTSDCPVYPPHLARQKPPLLRLDLDDDTIDTCLQRIADSCGISFAVASTQYGRRIMVDAFIRYSGQEPVEGGVPVPETYSRNQPR